MGCFESKNRPSQPNRLHQTLLATTTMVKSVKSISQKKEELLNAETSREKNARESWESFIKKDTYLIAQEKSSLESALKKASKYPWHYWFSLKVYRKSRESKARAIELISKVENYNREFIEKRLIEYADFFSGKQLGLKYNLDQDQRLAIVKDDKHNIVVAGAGSGKTSALTSRIAYLTLRKDKVEKEKVLALAFTRAAAEEMQDRLLNNYKLDASISTFHSLGLGIIQKETGKRPHLAFEGTDQKQHQFLQNTFDEILKDKSFQELVVTYMAYHFDDELEEASFKDKLEYFRYMQNKRYTTLNGIPVKSFAEKDIGNYLFTHGVKFEYETIVEWADKDLDEKLYRPDFYLPDFDFYIEHWGMDRNLQVPEWFTQSSLDYKQTREWKLAQFQKHQK